MHKRKVERNRIIRNRSLPYKADYKLLKLLRKIGTRLFYIYIILPFLIHFTKREFTNKLLNFILIVTILSYYLINIYTEVYLCPKTAIKRRRGFLDNSLGSKFLESPVKQYYSNDSIHEGAYKMLVNCGESCYFTLKIVEKMTPHIVIKNAILFISLCFVLFFQEENYVFIVPLLQTFLSSIFLTELIEHFHFKKELELIFNQFLYIITNRNQDEDSLYIYAIALVLDYETVLAYNKSSLSDKVYRNLNEKLSEKWEEIIKRYDI